MSDALAVVKIGGSVLTGARAFTRVARYLAERIHTRPDQRLLAVVSAQHGLTDELLATARAFTEEPDAATLDLLWSTGETRSAALLALALQACGINAAAANVHQTGLVEPPAGSSPGQSRLRPLRLRALLAHHDVVVAPGFLARGSGDALVSLGRGGSDLTAVLLAAGLNADQCELLKDVPGYFSADPKRDPSARPLDALSYETALEMAAGGCELVQRHALEAARTHGLPIVVSALGHERATRIAASISTESAAECAA